MNVVEKSAEGLSRTFEVVVPASELEAKLTAKIEEIRPEVRLKGFRPGKVPANHIRKMFGASIMGDILQELVPQATQDTLDERKIRPASQPAVDVKSDPEKGINDDPGVKEALESMRKNAGVERADVVELVDTDPNRRSAMQFGVDDENSTDWIK